MAKFAEKSEEFMIRISERVQAGSIGLPREFVDGRKRERLRSAAAAYLSTYDIDAPARFDVAEVYAEKDGRLRVEYLENAFE